MDASKQSTGLFLRRASAVKRRILRILPQVQLSPRPPRKKQVTGFSSRGQKPHWGFFLFLLSSELHSKNRSSFQILSLKKIIDSIGDTVYYFGRGVGLECRNYQALKGFVDDLVGLWLTFRRFYAFTTKPALLKYSSTFATFSFWKLSNTSE